LREASVTGFAVELSITDTGIGIPKEALPRIFEPFYTTKDPGQGPGLGLPSVFATVRRARGQVDAVSQVGQGTTIRMLLPECAPPFTERVMPPRSQASVAEMLEGSVLVVEDDSTVRAVTVRMLRTQGFDVLEADEGTGALAILRDPTKKVGLLITDIALPNGSGVDLMLAARVVNKSLPVLLTSGHATDTRWRTLIDATEAPFLPKPFTRQQLEQAIAATLAPA
jgi:two-component system cell cycle sensor histidine kinase/response regulator CckA